jgi:two-component system cell cycle sensor histidine kinase/response regulator CckA
VDSIVGSGTTFRVYFPRLLSAPIAARVSQSRAPMIGGNEGILLVEDEPAVREVAEAALMGLGYQVFPAVSGRAALEVWVKHQQEIDLVLTDLVMPDGVTGRDLATRLRAVRPGLPVVYMSGYSHEVAGEDFILQVGVNYLPKPFDLDSLARIVRSSLDRRVGGVPADESPSMATSSSRQLQVRVRKPAASGNNGLGRTVRTIR